MRGAAVLAAAIALLSTAPAMAQESVDSPDDQVVFVSDVSASPDRCNIDNARAITLHNARRNAVRLHGKCVAVRGWWRDRELFAEKPMAEDDSDLAPEIDRRHLGLYGDWDRLGDSFHQAVPVVAIGYLSDCASLNAGQPGTMLGYCHNSVGPLPILILSQIVR